MEKNEKREVSVASLKDREMSISILEEQIRKNYLSRASEMQVAPVQMPDIDEDIIDNVRIYHISEMVYKKGESSTDKFATVFNTLSNYNATVFIIIDSDGKKTDFYVGVRNNEFEELKKRSTVTLGDTLKNTLIGQFPGTRIEDRTRKQIKDLSERILDKNAFTSVSVLGSEKVQNRNSDEEFVQGIEKLGIAMSGRAYTGIIIANNISSKEIQNTRRMYQNLYTQLSPLQRVQMNDTETSSQSHRQSFFEFSEKEKAAWVAQKALEVAGGGLGLVGGAATGALGGAVAGGLIGGIGAVPGAIIGGITGGIGGIGPGAKMVAPINSFIEDFVPRQQITETSTNSISTTIENKTITDLMKLIDENLKRIDECDSYGMWSAAAYFVSDDMTSAEIAASNYRSLMSGDKSGKVISAINSWRKDAINDKGTEHLAMYLSRFVHPLFCIGYNEDCEVLTDVSTAISGKELGLHLGLPRNTISGLPVIEHAEFGKEVVSDSLIKEKTYTNPEDYIILGKVYDLGQITNRPVNLDNNSLGKHTFITGSTGSGKSNTVNQMLCELHQDGINFLVIEPAKGEYKDYFGQWEDVNVFSTNPNVAEMIQLNPFMFPKAIHVLEHIDGLVEIFSVCWPLYDAMPAFLKEAILKSYEYVGWDLGSSTFDGDNIEYPDFDVLVEQLDKLIEASDYASDIKSNYRGALITRVKSLTVGLNKFIFNSTDIPYERIFDENCILDISRIKSSETKALIMGMMVYALNEYRNDKKTNNNSKLRHVTVLEEAHNLLKNTTDNGMTGIVGKSVEMISQTIAEIRTYGEGFIIVDQSPSSVDISAIKNTNTKIVLRTPEANDREVVGKSMGLSEDQVNEIAKLPDGVAVVYQDDWISPVLAMISEADVKEIPFKLMETKTIRTKKEARTNIIKMVMDPWIGKEHYSEDELKESLKVLDIKNKFRKRLLFLIDVYIKNGCSLSWNKDELVILQQLIQAILEIEDKDYLDMNTRDDLIADVKSKLKELSDKEIEEICFYITYTPEG